jgi:hypothetical protein
LAAYIFKARREPAMPFDGTTRTGFLGHDDMLLDMVEFALDGGRNWLQRAYKRGNRRCLLETVRLVRKETGSRNDRIIDYLAQGITNWKRRDGREATPFSPYAMIVGFNDATGREFSDIVEVIREARQLAQQAFNIEIEG